MEKSDSHNLFSLFMRSRKKSGIKFLGTQISLMEEHPVSSAKLSNVVKPRLTARPEFGQEIKGSFMRQIAAKENITRD